MRQLEQLRNGEHVEDVVQVVLDVDDDLELARVDVVDEEAEQRALVLDLVCEESAQLESGRCCLVQQQAAGSIRARFVRFKYNSNVIQFILEITDTVKHR